MKRLAGVVLWFVSLPMVLLAQQTGGSVTGHVFDPSGAAVAGAKITARSVTTGGLNTAESDAAGIYQLPFLNPSEYQFTVDKEGFKKLVQSGISLTVGQKAVLDFTLELGSMVQSVSVVGNAPLLQPESGDRGWTVASARVAAIPLRGLNVIQSTWSAPGVTVVGSVTKLRPFDTSGSQQESINGGQAGQNGQTSGNLVLVDGISSNTHGVGVGFNPIHDAVQEVTVQGTMYDAQYGWSTGGVVQSVTRGGTNAWHGDAYEYLQNTHLNANSWGNNRAGIPRIPWHINMFGGSAGGPLAKNKWFVFSAFQAIKQVQPDPSVTPTAVPTGAMRNGDFSQVLNSSGKLQTIYDPLSTVCSGGSCTRTPFPGNMITNINPVAKAVLALIPPGNVPASPVAGSQNLVPTGASRKFVDSFPELSGRVDYNLSDRTRAFFRYSWNRLGETRGYLFSTVSTLNIAETSTNSPFTRANEDFTFQLTHSFNPTTVLQFRTGMDRFTSTSGSNISVGFDNSKLQFAPLFVSEAAKYFPKFNWTNYSGAGSNQEGLTPFDLTYSNEAVVAKTFNKHNVRFGFQNMEIGENVESPGFNAGNFSFTGTFTTADPLHPSSATGNSIADFLLGYPAGGFIDVNSSPALMERLWSAFGQDDIHVSRKLTLNVGLRWDDLGPLSDRFNALTRGFCITCASPLQVPGMNLQGGLVFAGVGGNSRGIFNGHYTNFAPRFGFAYQLMPKTVLRGGYGMMYGQAMDNPGAAPGFSQRTNMVASVQTGIPFNTLTNPFPSGILTPVGSSQGLLTGSGQGVTFVDPDMNIPRTQQYSLEIQREFGDNWLATVAYVGSYSTRLNVTRNINFLPLSALQLGAAALTASVPNPFLNVPAGSPGSNLLPGTFLAASKVQQQQLLVPYPQFPINGVTEQFIPIGKSKYNSLQVEMIKRLSAGLDFSVAYTWEKTMQALAFNNPQDLAPAWVISPFDVPQQLKISAVWYLPLGPGKHYASSASPLVSHLIGGWFVSADGRGQQGMPMNFPSGVAPTANPQTISNQSLSRWFNTCTLLANATTQNCLSGGQPAWQILNPFQLTQWSLFMNNIRKPGIDNLNLALAKQTQIKERYKLAFRADFLNAFNTTQWFNGPNTSAASTLFGHVDASIPSNDPRVIMLSLRLDF